MPSSPSIPNSIDSQVSLPAQQPTMAEDLECAEFTSDKSRRDFLERINKASEKEKWGYRCADVLAAFMLKKSTAESSPWAHWDVDVRRGDNVFMLHARCKTNPTTHIVNPRRLTDASKYGISNWSGTVAKFCVARAGSSSVSAIKVIRASPLIPG